MAVGEAEPSSEGIDEVVAGLRPRLNMEPEAAADVRQLSGLSLRELFLRVGELQRTCVPAIALAQRLAEEAPASLRTTVSKRLRGALLSEDGRFIDLAATFTAAADKIRELLEQRERGRTDGSGLEYRSGGPHPYPVAAGVFPAPRG